MIDPNTIYSSILQYVDADNLAHSHDIKFTAPSELEAVRRTMLFFADRNKHLEDIFNELLAFKVAHWDLGELDDEGMCSTRSCIPFFEYKYDTSYVHWQVLMKGEVQIKQFCQRTWR